MDFKTFKQCAELLPAKMAVCIRGRHGIGKSEAVYQLAKEEFNVPVIERRLSQMCEGDMVGLPVLEKLSDNGSATTEFAPPTWFMNACDEPHVLFLDELNRATPEIMQAAFQIVLDREMNGHKLHPDTRVYTAVNVSADYNVNDMDPALLDRFWVVDLDPTTKDWLDWAKDNVNGIVHDFILNNPRFLEHQGMVEAGRVYPSRRSWKRLSDVLVNAKVIEEPKNPLFYALSLGMVGAEASIAFVEFVSTLDKPLEAADVLDNWKKNKLNIERMSAEKLCILIKKIADSSSTNTWTEDQTKNIAAMMKVIPAEHKVVLWSSIVDHRSKEGTIDRNLENVKAFHKLCKKIILEAVTAGIDASKSK